VSSANRTKIVGGVSCEHRKILPKSRVGLRAAQTSHEFSTSDRPAPLRAHPCQLRDGTASGGDRHLLAPAAAQRANRAYLAEIARTDIQRVDGVRRDPIRVERVLRSLARNVATQVSIATIAADAGGQDGPLERETVRAYLDSLERLMIVEDAPAWAPALRSRARLRTAVTRHFVDPCLAVAALNASPSRLLSDLNLLGFLFENLAVRDLRVYLQHVGGQVLHYRDSNDLEVDLILETEDGQWGAVEVKLGSAQVDTAAQTLLRFATQIDTSRCGDPAFLAVVTATGFGDTRPDGVCVLPIATLAP
jgi:predicted AAA+ superfamily ATPase